MTAGSVVEALPVDHVVDSAVAPGTLRRTILSRGTADRVVGSGLVAVAAFPIALYFWVAFHRIGYPYELEWMEGGSVEVVRRVVEGHNIYGPPSLHFTPWPYPPLYFWITAGLSKVIGVGFLPLRLVSLVASAVVLWLLYRMVTAHTGDRVAGVVTAGIYAATFRLSGAWADIGRVDSLFMAFALAAIAVAWKAQTRVRGAAVGLLLFLCFFTKQDGLIIAVPLVVWMLIARRKAGLPAVGVLVGLVAISTVLLDEFSNGWYRYYVFRELTTRGIVRSEFRTFWTQEIGHRLWILLLTTAVGVVVLVAIRRRLPIGWRQMGLWMSALAGLIGAAWIGRIHLGGYDNVLMPAFAAVALLAGLVIGLARHNLPSPARTMLSVAVLALLVFQFTQIGYSPSRQIPSAGDAKTGAAFIAFAHRLPGRAIIFDHPYYGTLAGKGSFADEEAASDIERSGKSLALRILVKNMRTQVLQPDIGAVIVDDGNDEHDIALELVKHYHLLTTQAVSGRNFYPVTDLPVRPALVFVRDGYPSVNRGRP